MARRKPIYQAVPRATIQRRRHHRQLVGVILAITAVATVIYAFAANAILRDSPVHAGAITPGPTATATALVAAGSGIDTAASDPTMAPTDLPALASGDSSGPAARATADPLPADPPPADPSPTPDPIPPRNGGTAEPEALTGYQWPLHGGRISSFFEDRSDGFVVIDGERVHDGLDVATYCGDHVGAAHEGTVLEAGRHFDRQIGYNGSLDAFYARLGRHHTLGQLPIVVVIDDGNGYRSLYVHLEGVTVHRGEHVRQGQLIGYEGATGAATGCHLHYGLVRMDGAWLPVARELVKKERYPSMVRERIDPLRVLSLQMKWAPRLIPGINPPRVSPGLDYPTVP
jgi:murein DD-endopeptidase MepM/ murein hydrolase activator NlpD